MNIPVLNQCEMLIRELAVNTLTLFSMGYFKNTTVLGAIMAPS